MTQVRGRLLASVATLVVVGFAATTASADQLLAAALPEETEADANIKRIFHNQCTGCHTPGYLLQFKFDEAGWNKVINLMKFIPNYPGPDAKANAIIQFNQKELAAYLARARGP